MVCYVHEHVVFFQFAVFLLFIFVVQLAVGIYALTHKDDFRQNVEKGLDKEFVKIGQDPKVKRLFEGMERDVSTGRAFACDGTRETRN